MSSDIFSRPVDISKYALIYGGAQKNLAPAGVTFVIVKDNALGKVTRTIPSMLNYKIHAENGSMFNTPPVVPIYSALQTLKWYKQLVMEDNYKELEKEFLDFAVSRGMVGIKGHRSVGGFRASIYNAMPVESVKALTDVMKEFEKNK